MKLSILLASFVCFMGSTKAQFFGGVGTRQDAHTLGGSAAEGRVAIIQDEYVFDDAILKLSKIKWSVTPILRPMHEIPRVYRRVAKILKEDGPLNIEFQLQTLRKKKKANYKNQLGASFVPPSKYRLEVTTKSGKKLRGTWWQPPNRSMTNKSQTDAVMLSDGMEDAIRKNIGDSRSFNPYMQLDIPLVDDTLVQTPDGDKKNLLVSIELTLGEGSMNPEAVCFLGDGTVFLGTGEKKEKGNLILGRAGCHFSMRNGLVDATWTRGKSMFWKSGRAPSRR